MSSFFVNNFHKERFKRIMLEDCMSLQDLERASLFYILSGNEELFKKRMYIYDFCEHSIRFCFEDSNVDFSSSMCSLIRLGFNLYNSWSDNYTTPMYLLGSLDSHNLLLAENAMRLRFNILSLKNLVEQ